MILLVSVPNAEIWDMTYKKISVHFVERKGHMYVSDAGMTSRSLN
jgi:hypothetical protein